MVAEAFRLHSGAVLALAQLVLNDDRQAEAVVRDVYVRLGTHPESFEAVGGSLRSYLLVLCRRLAVDRLRHNERGGDIPSRTSEQEPNNRHLVERVDGVLAVLSPEEREAVELAYFEGYSYREVAVILATPAAVVKARLRTGMSLLRRAFIIAGMSAEELLDALANTGSMVGAERVIAATAIAHAPDAERLRAALINREAIGVATGVIMGRDGVSADEAFDRLAAASRELEVQISVLARRVAAARYLPPGWGQPGHPAEPSDGG